MVSDAKRPSERDKRGLQEKPIPFDEALRRLVNAPPKHKAKAETQPKKGKTPAK
jgi:hypothetical protein